MTFEDDGAALDVLDRHGVLNKRGTIYIPPGEHPDEVWAAIDYLSDEWDYDWIKIKP